MSKCSHCGKQLKNPEDIYTFQGKELCEDCAVMLQDRDFASTKVMGCDGPVGQALQNRSPR